jgi:ketosteroid isomerase-like protein
MASVSDPTDEAVLAANAGFYAAFESLDLDTMADVWERSDRASVTHPGWPTLYGWARVAGSWDAIFANTPFIQFFVSEEHVDVFGDFALVRCEESILQAGGSREAGDDLAELSGARVAAVNAFVWDGARWRMVMHHGSPVAGGGDEVPREL